MSLNRDYNFSLDIRTGKVTQSELSFTNTDSNVSNFYVSLLRDKQPVNITNYKIIMNVVNPNGAFRMVNAANYNEALGIIEINLPSHCTNIPGTYAAEFLIEYQGKKVTTDAFGYTVKSSIITDIDDSIVDDPQYSVLIELLREVENSKQTVQEAIDMIPSKEELVGPAGGAGGSAFSLFKTEEELISLLDENGNTKDKKEFSTLEMLSDDFKADLDAYIQLKIDNALALLSQKQV